MTLKNGSFLDIKGVYPSNGTPLGPVYVRNMLQTNETEYTENCQIFVCYVTSIAWWEMRWPQ